MDFLFDDDDPRPSHSQRMTTKTTIVDKKTKRTAKKVPKSKGTVKRKQKNTAMNDAAATPTKNKFRNIRATMLSRAIEQSKVPARSRLVETGVLTLGSDCSGMGMDYIALTFAGLPWPVKTAFCSEIDKDKTQLLEITRTSSPIHVMYNDIAERRNIDAPEVDLFISGAPCQAFSSAGKQLGASETRGLVILHSLNYVIEKLPSIVVFENVAGLLHPKHKKVFHTVTKVLKTLGYNVSHRLINTRDHGIPQSRPRVYIIGTSRCTNTAMEFDWPKEAPCAAVDLFLEAATRKRLPAAFTHLSPTAKRNVRAAKKFWGKKAKMTGCKAGLSACLGLY